MLRPSRRAAKFWVPALWIAAAAAPAAAQPVVDYRPRVTVAQPTRLDWIYPLANQSPAQPPADWLAGYDPQAQQYEAFIPPGLNPKVPAPLVLFI
jgi:hypothetical protein